MLERILHWVYCLGLNEALVLALLATALFFWLRRRCGQKGWWLPVQLVVLALWAGVVAVDTLVGRAVETNQVSLIPFQTYIIVLGGGQRELIRSAFMNVLLFYPGGLLAQSIRPNWRMPVLLLLFAAMSLTVEGCQFALHLGVAETDDVIHNTLGACLGMLALRQYEKLHKTPGGA